MLRSLVFKSSVIFSMFASSAFASGVTHHNHHYHGHGDWHGADGSSGTYSTKLEKTHNEDGSMGIKEEYSFSNGSTMTTGYHVTPSADGISFTLSDDVDGKSIGTGYCLPKHVGPRRCSSKIVNDGVTVEKSFVAEGNHIHRWGTVIHPDGSQIYFHDYSHRHHGLDKK